MVINRRYYCYRQPARQHFNVHCGTGTVTNNSSVRPRAHKQQRIFSGQLDVDKTQCVITKTLCGVGPSTCVQVTLQGPEKCVSRLFARLFAINAAVNPGYLLTVCLKHLRAANSASRLEMCGTVCNLTTDAVITSQQQGHALRRPSDDRANTNVHLCDCVWACTSSRVPPPLFLLAHCRLQQ